MVLVPTVYNQSLRITLLTFECITSLINIVIFSHLCYQIYGRFHHDVINKTTKIFSTSASFFYMLTTLFLMLHHSVISDSFHFSSIIISDISWTIGQLSAYFLWITRLYFTFNGSVHQSSNTFFCILASLAIIFAIGIGSAQTLIISQNHSHSKESFTFYAAISIIVCFVDLILSSLVIYKFLSRLHELTAHCRSNWTQIDEDHMNDMKTIKMVKAESAHFKTDKKALKKKKRDSQLKKLMILTNPSKIKNRVKTQRKTTQSRVLNDIAPGLYYTSTPDVEFDDDDDNDNHNSHRAMTMTVSNSSSPHDADVVIHRLAASAPNTKHYRNSFLISNIIAASTPNRTQWTTNQNPMQSFQQRKYKSVESTGTKKNVRHVKSKSTSAGNKNESPFQIRLTNENEYTPKLTEDSAVSTAKYIMSSHNKFTMDESVTPITPINIELEAQTSLHSNDTMRNMATPFSVSKGSIGYNINKASKKLVDGSSPTLTSVQSEPKYTMSVPLSTFSDVVQFKEEQFEEIVRSQSVLERYRENVSLDERQKLLVIVMTKYTILAIAAVLTTQLFVIFGVITTLMIHHNDHHEQREDVIDIVSGIYYFVWNFDCVVGSLCCYLNFRMNDELYHKLCACCQWRCRMICSKIAKRKIVDAMIDDRANGMQQYLLSDEQHGHY